MDLSSLLEPLIKVAQYLQRKSRSSASQHGGAQSNFSLDRTLGTAATLALTLGMYRAISNALKEIRQKDPRSYDDRRGKGKGGINDYDDIPNIGRTTAGASPPPLSSVSMVLTQGRIWDMVRVIIRKILMNAMFENIEEQQGGKTWNGDGGYSRDHGDTTMHRFRGSCHCKSVSFLVSEWINFNAINHEGKD